MDASKCCVVSFDRSASADKSPFGSLGNLDQQSARLAQLGQSSGDARLLRTWF
jgi:hypothetical protein